MKPRSIVTPAIRLVLTEKLAILWKDRWLPGLTTHHPLDGKVDMVGHSVEHTRKAMLSHIAYSNKLEARKAKMPIWLRDLLE